MPRMRGVLGVEILVSGGPPVPLTKDGSCVLWGATRSVAKSSARLGVEGVDSEVTSESCMFLVCTARGMESSSLPISSALSVRARFEEPRRSCRPRTRVWLLKRNERNLRNTTIIFPTSTPLIGGLRGSSTNLQ